MCYYNKVKFNLTFDLAEDRYFAFKNAMIYRYLEI